MTCSPGAGGGGALARYLSLSWSFGLENFGDAQFPGVRGSRRKCCRSVFVFGSPNHSPGSTHVTPGTQDLEAQGPHGRSRAGASAASARHQADLTPL